MFVFLGQVFDAPQGEGKYVACGLPDLTSVNTITALGLGTSIFQ